MRRLFKINLIVFPVALLVILAIAVDANAARKPWLGIYMQDLTEELAEALDLSVDRGVIVNEVIADSPAEEAGIKRGDVIVAWGSRDIDDTDELTDLVDESRVGDKISLMLLRDGTQQEITVVVGERDEPRWSSRHRRDYSLRAFLDHRRPGIGVSLQSLTGDLGEYFGVPDGEGALVTEVFDDSPAETAGLKAGDVIIKVDDEKVDDPSDVTFKIGDYEVGDRVNLSIVRDRVEQSIAVEVGEVDDPRYGNLESLKAFQIPFLFNQLQPVPYRQWFDAEDFLDSDQLEREMKKLERELRRLESDLEEIEERLD